MSWLFRRQEPERFCTVCGTPKQWEQYWRGFDSRTGERIVRSEFVCVNAKCDAYGPDPFRDSP